MPSPAPLIQIRPKQEAGVMADEKDKDQPREKAVYEKSTAQLDAERRSAALQGEQDDQDRVVEWRAGVQPLYGVEENGGYVGTDPIYQNAADERQEPLTSDEDWQKKHLAVPPAEDAGKPVLPYVTQVTEAQPVDTPAAEVTPAIDSQTSIPSPAPVNRQVAAPGSNK